MRLIDLTGEKFGRLTVIERAKDIIYPSGQKTTADKYFGEWSYDNSRLQ